MREKFFITFVVYVVAMLLFSMLMMQIMKGIFSPLVMVVVILAVNFWLLLFVISRVFCFYAQHRNAIAKSELIKKITQISIEDCLFTIELKDNCLLLTSPYDDLNFIGLLKDMGIKRSYHMKLWFDESVHLVRFKEYVEVNPYLKSKNDSTRCLKTSSGYICSTYIYLLNSKSKLVRFSNEELHKILIKVVTSSGWDLNLKLI